MKNIASSFTGFASSLLLNAGFTQVAQKLDPISSRPSDLAAETHGPAYSYPSLFTPKPRK